MLYGPRTGLDVLEKRSLAIARNRTPYLWALSEVALLSMQFWLLLGWDGVNIIYVTWNFKSHFSFFSSDLATRCSSSSNTKIQLWEKIGTRTMWWNLRKQLLCCVWSTSRIVSSSYVLFLSVIQEESESEDFARLLTKERVCLEQLLCFSFTLCKSAEYF